MPEQNLLPQVTFSPTQILTQLSSGQLLMIESNRRGGLIICKRHHAEFAGPGSAVGGVCDIDCGKVIPIGDLALTHPESHQERQKAYAMRQKWFRFTQKAMETSVPLKRAEAILYLFDKYFGVQSISLVSDETIGQLVGVFPKTVQMARQYRQNQSERQQQGVKVTLQA
ncbi:MAG TPA: hypothetical protein V6D28_08850 [Leptolyngbyaceae cyanobacterium]